MDKPNLARVVACSVRFDIQPGREGFVDFKSGQESMVYRAKNGHLMVVSVELVHAVYSPALSKISDRALLIPLQESTKTKSR